MRAHRGWIAAVLLIAMAFIGGLEVLDDPPRAQSTNGSSEWGEERGPRARDDADSGHWAVRQCPRCHHHWLAALPPSSAQIHLPPAPVRFAAVAAASEPADPAAVRDHRARQLGACSPETLQTFRC